MSHGQSKYWIAAEGIDREVLAEQIVKYLGSDAHTRPDIKDVRGSTVLAPCPNRELTKP